MRIIIICKPMMLVFSLLAMVACTTVPNTSQTTGQTNTTQPSTIPNTQGTPNVPNTPTPATPARPLKIGIALGGGAARGFAHIGVIKALEAAGIQVDVVAGTSAGSLVGALYAAGFNGVQLQQLAQTMDEAAIADWTISTRGLIKGEALQDYVNRTVGGRLMQQLRKPFIAVAADYHSGEAVYFQRGNTGQAVRASSSIPGIFTAVKIEEKTYVDGGLISPVPALAARKLGADFVIAVDISARPSIGATDSLTSVLGQTIAIMGQGLRREELKQYADFTITPPVGGSSAADFSNRNALIAISERAMAARITELKDKIAAAQQKLTAP